MKLKTIAHGSRSYTYLKCPLCRLVTKPGETIIEQRAFRAVFTCHRACLKAWLDKTYITHPQDGLPTNRLTRQQKAELEEAEFVAYREGLLARAREQAES